MESGALGASAASGGALGGGAVGSCRARVQVSEGILAVGLWDARGALGCCEVRLGLVRHEASARSLRFAKGRDFWGRTTSRSKSPFSIS
jgi:hypothetical protein